MMLKNCLYYVVEICLVEFITVVSIIKSIDDNFCFDRAISKKNNNFEFYVPVSMENFFLKIMRILKKKKLVVSYNLCDIKKSSIYE
jgi:hypothetical protein